METSRQGAKISVALVSDASGFGGAELYAALLVESLRGTVDFTAVVGEDAAPETRRRLEDAGSHVTIASDAARRFPSPGGLRGLRAAIRATGAQLVHVNLTDQGDGLGPLLAARLSGLPTVATLHLVVPGRTRLREAVSRRALRFPSTVIAVSASVADYARRSGAETVVVQNGLPSPSEAADARKVLGVGPSEFLVGGIGRLDFQKGWDLLCRAAQLVRMELTDAAFVVIGDGAERDRLARDVRCADVRFVGYHESASRLIGAFDVVAIPSRYEGFGLVAVEAMHAGVPIVAARTGGLPEVIGDCGRLVPPEDPEQLASEILRLARNPDLRADLAGRGKARAASRFTVERMASETLAVYRKFGI